MAGWDPFADPADNELDFVQSKATCSRTPPVQTPDEIKEPLNPWEDEVFVQLALDAAREEQERQAELQREAEERQNRDKEQAQNQLKARKTRVAERDRKLLLEAKTPAERKAAERRIRVQEKAYREAMAAVRGAPAAVAAMAQENSSDDELDPGRPSGNTADVAEAKRPEDKDGEAAPDAEDEKAKRQSFERAAKAMASHMGVNIKFGSLQPVSVDPVGLLFPDQCSRSLRLLSAARNLGNVPQMLESLRALLNFDPLEKEPLECVWHLFRGPEAIPVWMESPSRSQPVLYVSALAAIERLKQRRPGALGLCRGVAGLSLGALAACAQAEVFDFEVGLHLAAARGEFLEAAYSLQPEQRQLSVAGLEEATLVRICRGVEKETGGTCRIGQHLFQDGFLCTGHTSAMEALLARLKSEQGCKQVQLLKPSMGGAIHTSAIEPARQAFLGKLERLQSQMSPPKLDMYLGSEARPKIERGTNPKEFIDELAQQLVQPLNWEKAIQRMLKDGIVQFYECGPLQQLKGMMKRIDEAAYESMLCMDHVVTNVKEKPR